MTDLKKIKMRIENCVLMKENGISWKVTSECSEEMLSKNIYSLIHKGKCADFTVFRENVQAEIMQREDAFKYVVKLMEAGVTVKRIESLVEEIGLETLIADYSEDEASEVLRDERIEAGYMGIYLKYYSHDGLSDEEVQLLWTGIKWFRQRRNLLTDDWIGTIGEARKIMAEPPVACGDLTGCKDIDRCMEMMAEKSDLRRLLNAMHPYGGRSLELDDGNMEEMAGSAGHLLDLWHWAGKFFSKEQLGRFLPLWMKNHAMVYDLEFLKKKADSGYPVDREVLLASSASYVSFFYGESFPDQLDRIHEELVIYAITRRKKAFLRLLRENVDLYKEIPEDSVLFCRQFYEKCINLNALNCKNLAQLQKMFHVREENLNLMSGKGYTFDEVYLIHKLSKAYITLYGKLLALRSDDRIRVMREVIRRGCLDEGMNLESIAERLICKPLSEWIQKDFGHIRNLTGKNAARFLGMYRELSHLIPDIRNNAEARYVLANPEQCSKCLSMDEVRENAVAYDSEWRYLSEEFGFSEEFANENRERIREFIFNDGAHIFKVYYDANKKGAEELRRLVHAELMGRFKELKYFRDDLIKEIDYPVTEEQKVEWMRNTKESEGRLSLWEEDGLIPVMKMGSMPYETCLSYSSGRYRQCLLACHDANKKVVYMSYNGTVVLRAAIRLTKGTFQEKYQKASGEAHIHFADLAAYDKGIMEKSEITGEKEYLTLFLERAYVAGLPEDAEDMAFRMLFRLMQKKAESMNVLFAASVTYQGCLSNEMVPMFYSMYISRSKAGEQYLDSMGGSRCVNSEGSYDRKKYLLEKKRISIMKEGSL